MFKKNSYILGILLGVGSPAVTFGILYLLHLLAVLALGKEELLKLSSILLISLVINLVVLRYYFVKLKFDKTGRGVLLVTFVCFLLFFYFFHN